MGESPPGAGRLNQLSDASGLLALKSSLLLILSSELQGYDQQQSRNIEELTRIEDSLVVSF